MIIEWLMAQALAETLCATPQLLEQQAVDVTSVTLRFDGDIHVVPAQGDQVRVESCGESKVRLVQRGSVLELHARHPVDSAVVQLPASVARLAAHERQGALTIEVPAEVAVVSSEGPLTIEGASNVRVAWHQGDIVVSNLTGDLLVDRVTGSLRGDTIAGSAQIDLVSGPVEVQSRGALVVDGQR